MYKKMLYKKIEQILSVLQNQIFKLNIMIIRKLKINGKNNKHYMQYNDIVATKAYIKL